MKHVIIIAAMGNHGISHHPHEPPIHEAECRRVV